MPATLDGGPHFAGSRLDVAIANVAQFGNAPIFPTGATFPSGAGTVLFGAGDDVSYYVSGAAFEMDARQGTAAVPITAGSGPTFKISRTESITAATMPAGIGANNQGNAALWASATGDTGNQAQVSALLGTTTTASTQVRSVQIDPDACAVQGLATVTGSGVGTGIGAYFQGRRDTNTGKANGTEVRVWNQTASDGVYNAAGFSDTTGLWITASGTQPSAVAVAVGTFAAAQTFHTGFAAVTGSVTDTTFRDDTSSAVSLQINGAHANGSVVLASGSGHLALGIAVSTGIYLNIQPEADNVIGARVRRHSNTQSVDTFEVTDEAGAIFYRVGPTGISTSQTDHNFAAHIVSTASGAPTTTNLGANVSSVTFTGNDVRGTIAVVMSGALAANTRISTNTFAVSYGATSPKVTLVDQTSAVGLTIVNFYVSAQSTGVSFDLACDQALGAGTYTIDYIVIG